MELSCVVQFFDRALPVGSIKSGGAFEETAKFGSDASALTAVVGYTMEARRVNAETSICLTRERQCRMLTCANHKVIVVNGDGDTDENKPCLCRPMHQRLASSS